MKETRAAASLQKVTRTTTITEQLQKSLRGAARKRTAAPLVLHRLVAEVFICNEHRRRRRRKYFDLPAIYGLIHSSWHAKVSKEVPFGVLNGAAGGGLMGSARVYYGPGHNTR